GKKLRFWNIPDQPNAWETLLKAGVDFINTDDLQGLEQFLASKLIREVTSLNDYNHSPAR
ncbi:MAG TPA: hypothetical protein PK228_18070, partial [Saprospiraceae bacterium]|nr:hypothetical protein [Saprospiraceae bacterium]